MEEERLLLVEWYFMVGVGEHPAMPDAYTFSVEETFHCPCRKDSTLGTGQCARSK